MDTDVVFRRVDRMAMGIAGTMYGVVDAEVGPVVPAAGAALWTADVLRL